MSSRFTLDLINDRFDFLNHVLFSSNNWISYGLAKVVLIGVKSTEYFDILTNKFLHEAFEVEATPLLEGRSVRLSVV